MLGMDHTTLRMLILVAGLVARPRMPKYVATLGAVRGPCSMQDAASTLPTITRAKPYEYVSCTLTHVVVEVVHIDPKTTLLAVTLPWSTAL